MLQNMKWGHWVAVGIACAMAVIPILAQEQPGKWASIAPAALAVLAVLKHAADTASGGDSKDGAP